MTEKKVNNAGSLLLRTCVRRATLEQYAVAHTLVHNSYLNFSQIYCFSALKMSKIETLFGQMYKCYL